MIKTMAGVWGGPRFINYTNQMRTLDLIARDWGRIRKWRFVEFSRVNEIDTWDCEFGNVACLCLFRMASPGRVARVLEISQTWQLVASKFVAANICAATEFQARRCRRTRKITPTLLSSLNKWKRTATRSLPDCINHPSLSLFLSLLLSLIFARVIYEMIVLRQAFL